MKIDERKIENLKALMLESPPDFQKISEFLDRNHLSGEEVTVAGIRYVDECMFDYDTLTHELGRIPTKEEWEALPSAYIYDLLELLLANGLDPNMIYEEENIMEMLPLIAHGYVGADTMRLLLEHGGDLNLEVRGEPIFYDVDFDVIFGAIEMTNRIRYAECIHIWFVMIGFGAMTPNGKIPVTMTGQDDIEIFKQHEQFDYYIEIKEGDGFTIHIFERETSREVAYL